MSQNGSFPDLVERTRSAVILVVLAAGAFWIGGHAVILLLAVTSALMSWEIASMYGENRIGQITIAVIAAASFVSVFFFDGTIRLIFLVPLAATLWLGRFRSPLLCMIAIVAIIEISLALEQFSWQFHLRWTLWLIAVVAATDIGGYFAGRFIGGPKIFPRISPKKTWSGTVGGWVLAMVVSGIFLAFGHGTPALLLLTLIVSIASQAGDLAESSMKRRAGVKDSSNLIPGHGGLLDRFDGLLGGCLAIGVVSSLGLLPTLGITG
jgi:phosphatidate cytidylyltransferase